MSVLQRRHRALAAAAFLLPAPAGALATTYDLSNQTVNVAAAPYTAADILNTSNVTFTSFTNGGTLLAAVNLATNSTVNTVNGLTLAGALSGSATLFKSSTGTLTLAALSPSFTGPLTLNANGGTLRLGIESPLAGTGGTLTLGTSTTLDLNGFNSPGRTVTYSGPTNSVVNNNTTATSTLSTLPQTGLSLGGAGTLNLATSLWQFGTYTKVGTGTLTLSSPSLSYGGSLSVSAGTLQLGINAPFSPSTGASISIASGASLDLNGFTSVGRSVTLSSGAAIVNNNLETPVTLSSLAPFNVGGGLTLGGAGDINLTTRASAFTKVGTGTVSLSAGYTTATSGTLAISAGTVLLNTATALGNASSSPTVNLTGGTLDLNGYAAPGGTYTFNGGILVNNNTATPSPVNFSSVHWAISSPQVAQFGGDGDLDTTGLLPSNFYKFGTGNLILNTPQNLTGTLTHGSLRLAGSGAYFGNLTLYGSNVGPYFSGYGPGGLLDVYGNTGPLPAIKLYNNSGVVNNSVGSTVTYTGSVTADFNSFSQNMTFGGDGNLVIPSPLPIPGTVTLNKVGAGLLVVSPGQSPRGVNLRAGTYQAETDFQLGQTVSFLGGTLRVGPYLVAAKSSYTLTPAISVSPAGGTVETQRDTTLTGAFSGTGSLTKSGTATLTLSQSPSASVDLSVTAGTLRFATSLSAATIGSLTLSPGATVDLRATALTTTTPYLVLRQYLHDNQVTSFPDPTHRLAYLFNGDPAAPTSLTVRLRLTGDANFDGQINADDFALLDKGFAAGADTWWQGDFDYDGQVTSADYLLIDTTYAQTHPLSPALLSQRESQFGAAYVAQLLTSVPEPSSLACLFAALPLLTRRRRA